jgi:hypothetical protein
LPKEKTGSYQSYLLRCWQEKQAGPEQPPQWRFMLQEVSDAQRHHAFGSFAQLVAFLRKEILEEKGTLEGNQASAC